MARTSKGPLPATALKFTGPILPSAAKQEDVLVEMTLPWVSAASSSGAGLINAVIPENPQNAELWTANAAVYDQYRVLGFEVEYVPGCSALSAPLPIFCHVIDRDTSAALTTYALAAQYSSFMASPLDRGWKQTYKMNGSDESQFRNTASPNDPGSLKTLCVGTTNSTTWGQFIVRYRIQFRGTGR